MAWFETPDTLGPGTWGWHWTMENRDPEYVNAASHRQIASHYYPRIGPYASRDRAVIEWQLRLMRLAGISGILIDW